MVPFIQPCPVLISTTSPILNPLASAGVAGAPARPAPPFGGVDDCAPAAAVSARNVSVKNNRVIVFLQSGELGSQACRRQKFLVGGVNRPDVALAETLKPPAEDHQRDAEPREDDGDREEGAAGEADVAEQLQLFGGRDELLLLRKQHIRIARAAGFQASEDALFVESCELAMRSRWHQAHVGVTSAWMMAEGCLAIHCAGTTRKLSPDPERR